MCYSCFRKNERRTSDALERANASRESEIIDQYRASGNLGKDSQLPPTLVNELKSSLIVTNGDTVPGSEILNVIDVVSSDVAYAMNIFKDFANSVRDVVGGRSETIQKAISEGRTKCLEEMKIKAAMLAADAVISVRFDFTQVNTGGAGGILLISATGTAIKIRKSKPT